MGRYASPDDFFRLAEEFSQRDISTLIGIDRETFARWRSRRARIPWSAYQLLHDHSRYGLAERDAAEHFNRSMLLQLNDALHRRVQELEGKLRSQARLVNWGCANDPFIWPSDPRANNELAP